VVAVIDSFKSVVKFSNWTPIVEKAASGRRSSFSCQTWVCGKIPQCSSFTESDVMLFFIDASRVPCHQSSEIRSNPESNKITSSIFKDNSGKKSNNVMVIAIYL